MLPGAEVLRCDQGVNELVLWSDEQRHLEERLTCDFALLMQSF